MDFSKFTIAPHANIPDAFIPVIGRVIVEHAHMDHTLQDAICIVAGVDYSVGISLLSEVPMTRTRAEIFKNLARTKEPDLSQLAKMLVVGDLVIDLSRERNIIAHSWPYWINADATELGYFKEENKTVPQIAIKPPYRASVKSLNALADNIRKVGVALFGLRRTFMPEGFTTAGMTPDEAMKALTEKGRPNPLWTNDALFPWPDKFACKFQKESQRPQNIHRILKSQQQPSLE